MHDVRPLECERTRQFLSVRLDDALSHFERLLVDAHLAGCDACRVYDARIGDVTAAIRSAPLERIPVPVQLPER
jgi:predicted anti-sigma-YlaC factor YlaD